MQIVYRDRMSLDLRIVFSKGGMEPERPARASRPSLFYPPKATVQYANQGAQPREQIDECVLARTEVEHTEALALALISHTWHTGANTHSSTSVHSRMALEY